MLESIQKTQSPLALAPALAAAIKRGEEARLEGATPLEKLQKGEIEPVVLAAKCYGSHSAA